jgi:hypothetical protein
MWKIKGEEVRFLYGYLGICIIGVKSVTHARLQLGVRAKQAEEVSDLHLVIWDMALG